MLERRSLLAGLAALPAAGLPIAVLAAAPQADPFTRYGAEVLALHDAMETLPPGATDADPDAELFRLLDRYPAAVAAMKAAGDRSQALWEAFVAQEPERPAALLVRFGDDLGVRTCIERNESGRWVDLYDLAAVTDLRSRPLPTRSEWEGEPAPWDPDEQVGRWVRIPDDRRTVRRAEILAAHDAWWAECDAIKDRLGIPAVDEADERATEALRDLQEAILATEPVTLAELFAKARWAERCHLGAVFATDWHRRIVEDVVALAGRGGVAS